MRTGSLVPWLVPLIASVGCGTRARAVPAWHLVVPAQASVADARLGFDTPVVIALTNTGHAEVALRVASDGPFQPAFTRHRVPARGTRNVVVLFRPGDYEPASGVLTVVPDDAPESSWSVALTATVTRDGDGDGHDAIDAGGDDCDDVDPERFPGLEETCDGLDNDCNEVVDDVAAAPSWWPDGDGDGYGRAATDPTRSCEPPAPSWSDRGDDCDDSNAAIHPGAAEIWYDGVDGDCDGGSDFDRDRDGFDAMGHGGDDCNDDSRAIHPGADDPCGIGGDTDCDGSDGTAELDDGLDNDCDVLVDEDYLVRGDLVFTELFLEPQAVATSQGQWIELVNASGRTLDLAGMTLWVGASSVVLDPATLAPGDAVVACSETDSALNGGVTCSAQLPDALDTGPVQVDAASTLDEVDWSGFLIAVPGRSIELDAAHLDADDNDLEESWCVATNPFGDGDLGTPGLVVSPCG